MWELFWEWAIKNYIFHAIIALGVVFLIFFPKFGKRLKRFKAGPAGVEVDVGESDIDPKLPCPYVDSRNSVIKDVERLNDKLDVLCDNDKKQEDEILCIHGKLDSLCLDLANMNKYMYQMMSEQAKQNFYDRRLPAVEQLIGGLRYISLGGNGETKSNVTAMARGNRDLYEGIVKLRPDLVLE